MVASCLVLGLISAATVVILSSGRWSRHCTDGSIIGSSQCDAFSSLGCLAFGHADSQLKTRCLGSC